MKRIPRRILVPGLLGLVLLTLACQFLLTPVPAATPTPIPSPSATNTPEVVSYITILSPEKVAGEEYRGPYTSGEWFKISWKTTKEAEECVLSIAPDDEFKGEDEYSSQAPEVPETVVAIAYIGCVFTDGSFELKSVQVLFNPKQALPEPPDSSTAS